MAYYFDHQAEIDAEIAEEERLIEAWRKSSPPPFVLQLERLWKAIGSTEPAHALRKQVDLFASEGKRKEQIQALLHWLLQRVLDGWHSDMR